MMKKLTNEEKKFLLNITKSFITRGEPIDVMPFGDGNINNTYRVQTKTGDHLLQRVNTRVFRPYDGLHRNIKIATGLLKQDILRAGGNPDLEVLTLIDTLDGMPYYYSDKKCSMFKDPETGKDDIIGCFRLMNIIPDANSINNAENPEQLGEMADYLSKWSIRLTKQFDEHPEFKLVDTLPGYHDTPAHFAKLVEAVRKDPLGRYKNNPDAKKLMAFYEKYVDKYSIIMDGIENNTIAQGVIHRDPKINNFMYNTYWGHIQALIDLDTFFYHPFAIDLGDAARASVTAPETERDLSKVKADLSFLSALLHGYLKNIGPLLTEIDWKNMRDYLLLIWMELGIRFFADHLIGDEFFSIIDYLTQNLDKALNMATGCQSLIKQQDSIDEIIEECYQYKKK